MIKSIKPWLKCYTNGKDNTECCKNAKVPELSKPQCLDFCNGTKTDIEPDIKYAECPKAKLQISKCNHE